jgi:hypothetical protein
MAPMQGEIVIEYIKAYNAKDVKALLSCFDEGCVFENISAGKLTVRTQNKEELRALATTAAQAFATRHQKILTLTEASERIVAEIEFRGQLQADLASDLKAGAILELRGVSVFEFAADKIARLTDYS